MCGIAGIFHADRRAVASLDLLQRMTTVLRHRGPDEGSYHLDGPIGLGHRRLSIIDVGGGRQPIYSYDKSKVIVYNGEIYNFLLLRRELEDKGYRFETQSDTEVILRAYEEYGTRCVERLRGMFAFAIWDGTRRQLFLARDRVGIKPLYYHWDGRRLLFGSEIKAILEDPSVDRTLDPLALDDYLTFLYVPAPKTIFRAVRKLRPGHTLVVSERGLEEREYWDLEFAPDESLTEVEHAERLRETIRESVALHLVSEVPLGAFLSGGIDSSAVVGIMAGLLTEPVNTASIGFYESGFDELPYARLVARRFGTRAHERTVDADATAILDELVWHFDEPFADSSMVPTYYVSQVARERVTVALSGDGGDENFAGYRRYRIDRLEDRVRRGVPEGIRQPLLGTLARLYPKADWLPRALRARTLLRNASLPPDEAYYRTMTWFAPEMRRELYHEALRRTIGDYQSFSVMAPYFDRARDLDPLSRIQYVDVKTYLVDDILAKVDRASMAHSLEVRVPLLDHEVMECAARIPARYKLKGREGKHVFKQAMADLLPPEVLHRPKMGFSLPLARWLRNDLRRLFEERVLSRKSFVQELLEPTAIRRWWGQHQRGTRDYAPHLWALLILECWGRKFMSR